MANILWPRIHQEEQAPLPILACCMPINEHFHSPARHQSREHISNVGVGFGLVFQAFLVPSSFTHSNMKSSFVGVKADECSPQIIRRCIDVFSGCIISPIRKKPSLFPAGKEECRSTITSARFQYVIPKHSWRPNRSDSTGNDCNTIQHCLFAS